MESACNMNLEFFLFNFRDKKQATENLKWILGTIESIYAYHFV